MYSLLPYNTFGIDVSANRFIEYASVEELKTLIEQGAVTTPFLHIGGGSNLLFTKDYEGVVLHSRIEGIEVAHIERECRAHRRAHHAGIVRIDRRADDRDVFEAKAERRAQDRAQIAAVTGVVEHDVRAVLVKPALRLFINHRRKAIFFFGNALQRAVGDLHADARLLRVPFQRLHLSLIHI